MNRFHLSFCILIVFLSSFAGTEMMAQSIVPVKDDTTETTLEIYITNKKKTVFYADTPEIILKNFYTGEIVKRFKRTVDKSGNPEVIKDIPPGRYNMIIKREDENFNCNDFKIDAKMKTQIYVRVN